MARHLDHKVHLFNHNVHSIAISSNELRWFPGLYVLLQRLIVSDIWWSATYFLSGQGQLCSCRGVTRWGHHQITLLCLWLWQAIKTALWNVLCLNLIAWGVIGNTNHYGYWPSRERGADQKGRAGWITANDGPRRLTEYNECQDEVILLWLDEGVLVRGIFRNVMDTLYWNKLASAMDINIIERYRRNHLHRMDKCRSMGRLGWVGWSK